MARAFQLTYDNERLLRRLQKAGKVPSNIESLSGFSLYQTADPETGDQDIAALFGPPNGDRKGRAPAAIPLSKDQKEAPRIGSDDRLHFADVKVNEEEGSAKFVRQQKSGVTIRRIVTGLLESRPGSGNVMQDMQSVINEGKRLRYHGVFPLTADAAIVVGEGIDLNITAESKVLVDERFGRIKGIAGVARSRDTLVEALVDGPLLVGQANGDLRICVLQPDGKWKTYDVTDIAEYQKKFMDLAEKDIVYLAARAEDEKSKRTLQKKVRIIKAPANYDG